jgi:hypothetical protein
MSRRESLLSAAAVFLAALAVRVIAAAAMASAVPENTAYYVGVARNLAEGRGLTADSLFSYQTPPLELPRPAFEIWLPMPSLLAWIPTGLLGAGNALRASQCVSVLAGCVVALLAWRIAADVAEQMNMPPGRARTFGIGSGLLAGVMGPLVLYSASPDSTELFGVFSLAALLLASRLLRRPAVDRRLVTLGILIGLGALTRNEAIWIGLTWAILAWRYWPGSRRERAISILVPAAMAALVFSPWLARDWLAFGNPLPGQAIGNAFSVHGYDIFAFRDSPSLARFLGQGPGTLASIYAGGLSHNLLTVLVIPIGPIGLLGLLALPWSGRRAPLMPLALNSIILFFATSLLFPVATTQGTFLHSSLAAQVLLGIGSLLALDAALVKIGRIRHWTRPVAWIGPALAICSLLPLCYLVVASMSRQSRETANRYEILATAMSDAGIPLDNSHPVVTDHPIALEYATGNRAVALPEESPDSVLALAQLFDARLVIVADAPDRPWPAIVESTNSQSKCFREVDLTDYYGMNVEDRSLMAGIHVFVIDCR